MNANGPQQIGRSVPMIVSTEAPERLGRLQGNILRSLSICREHKNILAASELEYIRAGQRAGLTNARIGEALGLTEGAVRAIVRRAGDPE